MSISDFEGYIKTGLDVILLSSVAVFMLYLAINKLKNKSKPKKDGCDHND